MVKSSKGFYVGDICYVLDDSIYYDIWGEANYEDGEYDTGNGLSFAVAGTAYGDGTYMDYEGNHYSVDAGVIGVVPLELVTKRTPAEAEGLGRIIMGAGEAELDESSGTIYVDITLANRREVAIAIDTAGYDTDWEEEDWDDDDENWEP